MYTFAQRLYNQITLLTVFFRLHIVKLFFKKNSNLCSFRGFEGIGEVLKFIQKELGSRIYHRWYDEAPNSCGLVAETIDSDHQ